MLLRHATLARNLASICRAGLLTSKSQGKLPAVWLHSPSCSAWAGWHTSRRHGGRIEAVVILEIDLPRSWLRRVVTFAALAGPSVDDRTQRMPLKAAC
jgi:hypothetical protein